MCFKYLVLCCTEVIYTLKIKDLYWHLIVCENKNRVCMCLNVYCVKFKGMDYPKNKNAIIYYRWCNAYYVEQKLKVTLCFVGFSLQWKSMGSNVIWLPVDNLWKEMCFKYHLLCCTEKSKSYTLSLLASMLPQRTFTFMESFHSTKCWKRFFWELFTKRFFGHPKMVLLWHCCEKKPLDPWFCFWKDVKVNDVRMFMFEWTFPVREHYTMKSLCVSVWMRKL